MATFRITEFSNTAPDMSIYAKPHRSQPTITTSGTSQQSEPMDHGIRVASFECDGAVHVAFGDNPTATTSDWYIAASRVVDIYLKHGEKIAVIDA